MAEDSFPVAMNALSLVGNEDIHGILSSPSPPSSSEPENDVDPDLTSALASSPLSSTSSPKTDSVKQPVLNTREDLTPIISSYNLSTPFQNNFFQTLASPLGGYGSFAAQDLHRDDVILRESPLLVADYHNFYSKYAELNADKRGVFDNLCASEMAVIGTPRIKAIWDTNCFSISATHSAIFPTASRFNHACHPACTVSYTYDPSMKCLVMQIVADHVPKGQELTISYGKARTPMMLYLSYGFRCGCGSCEGVSAEQIEDLEPEW